MLSLPRPLVSTSFTAAALADESVLETPLAPADFALIFGCHNPVTCTDMALRAKDLYDGGLAPKIFISGGKPLPDGQLEADHMYDVLRNLGVPSKDIFLERESTNTLENAKFSHMLAPVFGLPRDASIILINQRFASLRGAMTMAAQWPESLCMTSPVGLPQLKAKTWRSNPLMQELMAGEAAKIQIYRERGDLTDIDKAQLYRRIHARRQQPRVMPILQPSVS